MNQLTVNSRAWYREFRNGPTFSTDTGVYSSYFKANTLERVKFETSITLKTFVLSTVSAEILFTQGTGEVFFTHPYLNWATEGFKIGDTISIRIGAFACGETITNLSGTVMTTTDTTPVAAGIGIVSGTSYPDLHFYNSTIPTSLIFQFGIVPNILPPPSLTTAMPNPFGSWLDGQAQAYQADGIGASPTALTGTMTPSAEISESVTCEYITTTDDYIHIFEVKHIFRVEFFKSDYLSNLVNNTTPFTFNPPYSFRYICQYKFGTSATDPNEFRIFNDNLLNGALGWVDDNFTNGPGDYSLEAISYEDPLANSLTELEVTIVNTVHVQIKNNGGNFPAGQKAILYVSKLPSPSQYSNLSDTWATTHVFATATAVDGGALIDSDFIYDMLVDVNADPTILDVIFDIEFSTAQKAAILAGERYFIGITVGDITLGADVSTDKVVWCDCNLYAKNSDISGLITGNSFECYSFEKTPNGTLSTTNIASWNNRLHQFIVHFDLTKNAALPTASNFIKIMGMKGQIVARNSVTLESFVLDNYDMPVSAFMAGIGGGWYQIVNQTNYRNFNIKNTAQANKSTIVSDFPGSYQTTQEWIVRWPMIVNWREWQANPNVPTSLYDALEEMNNQNYRTSNYSGVSNWVIYIRLLVTVNNNGVNTDYGIYSTACTVKDFDVQPSGATSWVATTEIFDEDGVLCNYLKGGHDMRIKTTFSEASVSGLTLANLLGVHTIEEYLSTADNWRLNSSVDWHYVGNLLKPLTGETLTKITQDIPNDEIIVETLVDKDYTDMTKAYNVYTHLEQTR